MAYLKSSFALQRESRRQIQKKLTQIKEVQTEEFWKDINILTLEHMRKELRDPDAISGMMVYIVQKIFTNLEDSVMNQKGRETLDAAYDFEDYRKKVNRCVEEEHKKRDEVIYS